MSRRLDAPTRRAEIIETTYRMIAEDGPGGLSLRAVARRCGMSAPGLMHHFPTLAELIHEVVAVRERVGRDLVARIVVDADESFTAVTLADMLVRHYYSENVEETRNFDMLEAESYTVGHPAHGAYSTSSFGPLPITRRLAERDFEDPEAFLTVLGLLADGLRARWLRDLQTIDRWEEWVSVRDRAIRGFARRSSTEAAADGGHPDAKPGPSETAEGRSTSAAQ